MKITDISVTKKGRYALFVDGEFLFSAEEEALVRSGLRPGMETDIQTLEALRRESEYIYGPGMGRCHLLEYKAYSRRMLLDRLRRQIDEDIAEQVADRLCELGSSMTRYYASTYARDLFRLKGYSRQRIAQALRQKGIEPDTIEEVLEQFDAGESDARLRELIRKKYARYLGEEKGRQRAVNALLRMGYKYGEIRPGSCRSSGGTRRGGGAGSGRLVGESNGSKSRNGVPWLFQEPGGRRDHALADPAGRI